MPSNENREKLLPLLDEDTFAVNEIVKLRSKQPTISILSVESFLSKEDFIGRVKRQNPEIKELIDQGSKFEIVFVKEPRESKSHSKNEYYLVVARVSEDIRKVMKMTGDRVYIDLVAHRVIDRYFVKRCNKCQEFGHYELKNCSNNVCCAYCRQNHKSTDFNQVEDGDVEHYECVNCKRENKPYVGHSSLWHKCPSFVEQQKKVKKSIPYYAQKND